MAHALVWNFVLHGSSFVLLHHLCWSCAPPLPRMAQHLPLMRCSPLSATQVPGNLRSVCPFFT